VDQETVDIRSATISDLSDIALLYTETFGRKKQGAYFEWQYFEAPSFCRIFVVRHCGEIVATMGVQKRMFRSGLTGAQLLDMIVVPSRRGAGIAKELAEHALRAAGEVDIQLAVPNRIGKEVFCKALGFSVIGKIPALIGDPDKLIHPGNVSLENHSSQQPDNLSFDSDELNWRFSRHPDFEYVSLGEYSLGPVFAKVFLDPRTGERYLDVVSHVAHFELDEVIRKGLEVFSSIDVLHLWANPVSETYSYALKMGFRRIEQERYLVARVMTERANRLLEFSEWNVCAGDAEYM
jgi:ribosomal protein S18 acetylase RimI-like enzyme